MLLTAQLANHSAPGRRFAPGQRENRKGRRGRSLRSTGFRRSSRSSRAERSCIERVDRPGERHEIALAPAWLTHGTFLDLAKAGVVLTAGGIYTAKAGEQEMTFKIDPGAASGAVPIISRLIRLQPAS